MRKKIKSVVIMFLNFVLAGAVLMGCGENQKESQQGIPISTSQETGQDSVVEKVDPETTQKIESGMIELETTETIEPETIELETTEKMEFETIEFETVETEMQTPEMYEDNFAVDSKSAKEFAEKVKDAVSKKDLDALAELTAFPVYVGLPGVDVIKTKEEFLKLGAEAVFTEGLMESIKMADIDNFQPSMAGFSISDGGTANINFGVTNGTLSINGINY